MISRLTEKNLQARLMKWALDDKKHILVAPNITNVYWWECDLLSVTKAYFSHEYEIKRSRADYKADFRNKVPKHRALKDHLFWSNGIARIPNYFWFVTADIEIEPPEYAGWIQYVDTGGAPAMWIKKAAPRLHKQKLREKKIQSIYRVISYRLKDMYWRKYKDTKK